MNINYESNNMFSEHKIDSRKTSYNYKKDNNFLNGMVKYETLKHEDAVLLITTLDNVIDDLLQVVFHNTDLIIDCFYDVVVKYTMSAANKNRFCLNGNDCELPSVFYYIINGDIDYVLNNVKLNRLYYLEFIRKLNRLLDTYNKLIEESIRNHHENYLTYSKMKYFLDNHGISEFVARGVFDEIFYSMDRIKSIINKLTYPFLRKVAQLAKKRAKGGNYASCMDNFQSGESGIYQAICHYDINRGSYASLVELWVNNRMLSGITKFGNSIKIPDKAYKYFRMYNNILKEHPDKSDSDIATELNISIEELLECLHLVDMQGMSNLINDASLEDFSEKSENYCYRDENAYDFVNTSMNDLVELSSTEKALLDLLYGYKFNYLLDKDALYVEKIRQLLSQFTNN